MSNPKTRQQWIYDLLVGKPNLSYGDCFTKYFQKFTKSRQTFTKDWNISQKRLQKHQNNVYKAKEEEYIKQEKKAVKRSILDKYAAMEILTSIAEDNSKKTTNNDRIKALSELAKYEGWHSPIKQENTIKGVDIKGITFKDE